MPLFPAASDFAGNGVESNEAAGGISAVGAASEIGYGESLLRLIDSSGSSSISDIFVGHGIK